jgi:hypothetical protein
MVRNHLMAKLAILITSLLLCGCFELRGVEHSLYGGISRSYDGGEVFSQNPYGQYSEGGSWNIGSKIKTIWGK